jgi:hypothetical protein
MSALAGREQAPLVISALELVYRSPFAARAFGASPQNTESACGFVERKRAPVKPEELVRRFGISACDRLHIELEQIEDPA